jgi:hypothetical protein
VRLGGFRSPGGLDFRGCRVLGKEDRNPGGVAWLVLDADVSLISEMMPVHIISSNTQLLARSDCLKAV